MHVWKLAVDNSSYHSLSASVFLGRYGAIKIVLLLLLVLGKLFTALFKRVFFSEAQK